MINNQLWIINKRKFKIDGIDDNDPYWKEVINRFEITKHSISEN